MTYGKLINYRDDTSVGDVKYVWELGRHQHLLPLAVAYAINGDRHIRDVIAAQVDGWIKANPYGMGIHWSSALEVSLRLISWAMVHSMLSQRDGNDGLFGIVADPAALGQSIYEQTVFVRQFLSRHSSANNHLIGELTGLWIAVIC